MTTKSEGHPRTSCELKADTLCSSNSQKGTSLFSIMRSVLLEYFKPVSQEDSRIEQSDNDVGVFEPS